MKLDFRRMVSAVAFATMVLLIQSWPVAGHAGEGNAKEHGTMEVSMKASSFKFEPSTIQLKRTGNLVIRVHNDSSAEHNITVKDPQGKIIASVDLPANKTVSLNVDLKTAGKYEFYCDKPLHAAFGMKGEITVTPD